MVERCEVLAHHGQRSKEEKEKRKLQTPENEEAMGCFVCMYVML